MILFLNRMAACFFLLLVSASVLSQEYAESWGPALGSYVQGFQADDQDGITRDLGSLSGRRGLLLVMSRSADW